MPNPGQIDHVEFGLADVPEKLRGPRIDAYLSVYLEQFNVVEDLAQRVLDAFLQWQTTGAQLDFVLDTIGVLLGQLRPDGYTNEQYAFVLGARVLIRRSTATRDDVLRVARYLAQGNPVAVFSVVPKILIVQFVDLVLSAQDQALYGELLTDAIDAVDGLEILYTTSATAGYDVGEYDTDLYA